MNCVKDDIARIVPIHAGLSEVAGRFVQCKELTIFNGEPAWVLDRRVEFVVTAPFTARGVPFYPGTPVFFDTLADKYLRPIRGSDGVDEMLRIAGHPLSESHRAKADANERLRELERSLEQGS